MQVITQIKWELNRNKITENEVITQIKKNRSKCVYLRSGCFELLAIDFVVALKSELQTNLKCSKSSNHLIQEKRKYPL